MYKLAMCNLPIEISSEVEHWSIFLEKKKTHSIAKQNIHLPVKIIIIIMYRILLTFDWSAVVLCDSFFCDL